jgi:cytochrome d ubiquinol oxidase subunit I
VHGLKDWPRDRRPPVAVVFFAFHLMVGLGVVMLAIIVRGSTLLRGGRLYERRGWLGACRAAIPIGFVAVLAGWTTTEAGRQPWTVQADAHRRFGHAVADDR